MDIKNKRPLQFNYLRAYAGLLLGMAFLIA